MSYERDAAVRAGQTQFGSAQIADMKAMLTNPNVSAEEKSVLLYGLSTMGAMPDEEIKKHAERIDALDTEDCVEGGDSPLKNIAHLRETYSDILARESQQAVEGARNALRQGGYSNSGQIIDQGVKGLRLFDEFFPYYERAGGRGSGGPGSGPGANAPVLPSSGGRQAASGASYSHSGVDPDSLRAGTDEFRGIDFTAFRRDAETLKEAYTTVDQSAEQLHKAWNSNTADWTGEASSVAHGRFAELTDGSGDLLQALNSAPENITTTVDEYIVKDVTRFSENVLDLYGDGRINELTPSQVGLLIGARENLPAVLRHLEEIRREQSSESLLWNIGELGVDFVKYTPITGVDAGKLLGIELREVTEENVAEELRKTRQLHTECGRRLSQFRAAYEARANTVHKHAREYVGAVQESYKSLIQSLDEPLDPPPFAMSAGEGRKSRDAQPAAPSRAGSPGGPGSSGDPGSSDDPGSGSGGSAPGVPAPGVSAAQAAETVPESAPEQGTFAARHGDTGITMSELDAGGEMTISVSGARDEALHFKLDFVPAGETNVDDGNPPGNESGSGETPRASDEARDGSGPGGNGEQGRDEAGEQRYTPGQDGSIRIERDGLEIVAEQPSGQGGPTVVTVDDGTGEPSTYTLGEQPADDTGSASTARESASGADGPDSRDERDESQSTSAQGVFGDVFDRAAAGDVDLGGADSGIAAGIAADMSVDDPPGLSTGAQTDDPAQPRGSAGLGSAPGGGSPVHAERSGDEEHGPSGLRIGGDLFGGGSGNSGAGGRISGSLDDGDDADDYGAYDHAGAGR